MAVPKRKTTKSRAGKRRSHIKVSCKNIIEDHHKDYFLNTYESKKILYYFLSKFYEYQLLYTYNHKYYN